MLKVLASALAVSVSSGLNSTALTSVFAAEAQFNSTSPEFVSSPSPSAPPLRSNGHFYSASRVNWDGNLLLRLKADPALAKHTKIGQVGLLRIVVVGGDTPADLDLAKDIISALTPGGTISAATGPPGRGYKSGIVERTNDRSVSVTAFTTPSGSWGASEMDEVKLVLGGRLAHNEPPQPAWWPTKTRPFARRDKSWDDVPRAVILVGSSGPSNGGSGDVLPLSDAARRDWFIARCTREGLKTYAINSRDQIPKLLDDLAVDISAEVATRVIGVAKAESYDKGYKEGKKEGKREGRERERDRLKALPSSMRCPLSDVPLVDAVITPSGHSYDAAALSEALARDPHDPITGVPVKRSDCIPNYTLRHAVSDIQSARSGSSSSSSSSSSRPRSRGTRLETPSAPPASANDGSAKPPPGSYDPPPTYEEATRPRN